MNYFQNSQSISKKFTSNEQDHNQVEDCFKHSSSLFFFYFLLSLLSAPNVTQQLLRQRLHLLQEELSKSLIRLYQLVWFLRLSSLQLPTTSNRFFVIESDWTQLMGPLYGLLDSELLLIVIQWICVQIQLAWLLEFDLVMFFRLGS